MRRTGVCQSRYRLRRLRFDNSMSFPRKSFSISLTFLNSKLLSKFAAMVFQLIHYLFVFNIF
ncbi:hypothetical protein ACSBR2_027703 [Camellia fascicularis]